MFNNFFDENPTVFELMWENIAQTNWPQMTVWGMRFTCWIRKAKTHTHNM
jgi:hypothetical protein